MIHGFSYTHWIWFMMFYIKLKQIDRHYNCRHHRLTTLFSKHSQILDEKRTKRKTWTIRVFSVNVYVYTKLNPSQQFQWFFYIIFYNINIVHKSWTRPCSSWCILLKRFHFSISLARSLFTVHCSMWALAHVAHDMVDETWTWTWTCHR